jgi:putative ABC transport system permease protein
MIKLLSILWNSFKMALQELRVNKLRTFLSLFGITIGIFCIIGVLATVDSLQRKIKSDIQAFGKNTIYIDKWQYSGGPDYPWWKFIKRPEPKFYEMRFIKQRSALAANVCFFASSNVNMNYEDITVTRANVYGISEEFNKIQDIEVGLGRYISESDFNSGNPVVVIGYTYAEDLFGNPERAIGNYISFSGKRVAIVGVIKKQGSNILDGFDYDHCVLTSYNFFASAYNVKYSNPFIMVNAKPNISSAELTAELRGTMRQLRKLGPNQEDNFSLNDVNLFSESLGGIFTTMNIGGWAIAGLSLLVGAFGVANIMFVTVRERTSQIGLKKAIGAKKRTILTEFLLESAFLSVLGGLIGLLLVWILTLVLSKMLPFPIFIAPNIILIAFSICIGIGVLAGIIPASQAARMDPVVAIRTK